MSEFSEWLDSLKKDMLELFRIPVINYSDADIRKVISAMVPAATPPPPDDEFTGNGIYHYHWRVEAAVDNVEVKISIPFNEPSCDCGAKAVGSEMHSHWCTVSKLDSN